MNDQVPALWEQVLHAAVDHGDRLGDLKGAVGWHQGHTVGGFGVVLTAVDRRHHEPHRRPQRLEKLRWVYFASAGAERVDRGVHGRRGQRVEKHLQGLNVGLPGEGLV